jgi:hypothetical protein
MHRVNLARALYEARKRRVVLQPIKKRIDLQAAQTGVA